MAIGILSGRQRLPHRRIVRVAASLVATRRVAASRVAAGRVVVRLGCRRGRGLVGFGDIRPLGRFTVSGNGGLRIRLIGFDEDISIDRDSVVVGKNVIVGKNIIVGENVIGGRGRCRQGCLGQCEQGYLFPRTAHDSCSAIRPS
nr:hypothetical protein GCM10017611_76240 [Rhodococcus wratislaviensis]